MHQVGRMGEANSREVRETIQSNHLSARPTILTEMAHDKILCAMKAGSSGASADEMSGKTLVEIMKVDDADNITLESWHCRLDTVSDMCYVTWNDLELLVMVNGWIKAYDVGDQEVTWSVSGKVGGSRKDINATSVTTDGTGRIFVVDSANNNVLMYAPDGTYIRVFIKEGYHGVVKPQLVSWWREEGALALCHNVKAGKDSWGIPRFKKNVSIFKMSASPDDRPTKQRRNSWRFSW